VTGYIAWAAVGGGAAAIISKGNLMDTALGAAVGIVIKWIKGKLNIFGG
jgi:hypothetical protein